MLSGLEDLSLLIPDVRFEELAKALQQRSGGRRRLSKSAKSGVIVDDSVAQRRLSNGFQGREKVLFLDLEVGLEMARERLENPIPDQLRRSLRFRIARFLAPPREYEASVVVVREIAQLGHSLHDLSDFALFNGPVLPLRMSLDAAASRVP